ncbi:BsuPI-related putative proteinase inhibitor [Bacillus sp. UNC41MFS5]|uniref:BsuPI-related putative proteinase inhibitor n=1 Tax=Bacillus sp. UNC41MFS5 TaxID=1449046 RepID=UPI00047CAF96|nr:BsuPI-related putative proteinase inhibitor [Bacillus sp. UNC41MFS5]
MNSKQLFCIFLFIFVFSLLTACVLQKSDTNQTNDSSNSNPSGNNNKTNDSENNNGNSPSTGIANFGIEGSLELKEDLSGLIFVFTLKNQSEQEKELVFPTSLKYDYIIRDENHAIVKQRSKEMVGADQIIVTKLKQGEELVYKENFNKVTKDLKKGNYTIEFISTAKKQDIIASLSFKIE